MKIVHLSELREALGIQEGEQIDIDHSPCYRERDEALPGSPPSSLQAWLELETLSKSTLTEMGLRDWGLGIMLFPCEWYNKIPTGFVVIDINGNKEMFIPGLSDDDIRFGCLAYGIQIKDDD